MTPCTAGEIRPLLADMILGVDTSGMGTYEIMNLIKAMFKDQPTPTIVDRLKAMIPDVTAPGMTLDEIMATIETRLTAKKALDTHLDQILTRLKVLTGVDVGNVDDGLYLAEAKIKAGAEAQAENASLHRILGRVKAKVNALLLNPREKITDLCQTLDHVQAEYDHVKARALKAEAMAVERENMISDAIGELRLILGVPKTEDLTLPQIVGVLKAKASEGHEHHTRLCGAVHMLTTTPADRVVNEIVRVVGSRDYYVKALLSRLCPDVDLTGKIPNEVLNMIEAQHKTLTERLGTSYAREIELTRELAEVKTRLETAGRESADLARALHMAEDRINAQSTRMGKLAAEAETLTKSMAKVLNLTSGMTSDEVARKIVEEVSFLRGQVDGLRGIAVKHRENLLSLLCEDPTRAVHMTVDEFQNLFKSKIAALALNVSLPEHATLNMIMERIQGMTPSSLVLHDLVSVLGTTKAMDANEAMRRATDKIRYAQKQTSRLIKILGDGDAQDLHGAVDKIQNMVTNMRPSLLILAELASALGMSTTVGVNEAMRRATDKIKALRDLLNS